MRHHGDDCGGSRKGIVRAAGGRKTDGERRKAEGNRGS